MDPKSSSGPLRTIVRLTKLPIAAVSTLSAATGYVAYARAWRGDALTACAGTLLMAMGACALNEWQERASDARMERTKRRPIPSGAIPPAAALAIALLLALAGGGLLLWLHGAVAAALGSLALLWYNGLYTPLKRLTAFAVVPGAVIGAIPPAIGWAAAGGGLFDRRLLALAFFFFLWQVPHFWLLLFKHGEEYAAAGFPSLTRIFTPPQLERLTFAWMLATAASGLLLPLYGLTTGPIAAWGLLASGAGLAALAFTLPFSPVKGRAVRLAFAGINLFACAVMALVVSDPFL